MGRELSYNKRLKMEGLRFLSRIPEASVRAAFFDPQYRGILDALNYGNEGKQRGKNRALLPQMTEKKDLCTKLTTAVEQA